MKKKTLAGIFLYLLGIVLFVVSRSGVVSGSPIHLAYRQRVLLCSAALCSVAVAPFLYRARTRVGTFVKFAAAAALIGCMIAFGGFANNAMAYGGSCAALHRKRAQQSRSPTETGSVSLGIRP